jgi:hypothetical protein
MALIIQRTRLFWQPPRIENRQATPATMGGNELTFAVTEALLAGYKSTRITWLACMIDIAAYPAAVVSSDILCECEVIVTHR